MSDLINLPLLPQHILIKIFGYVDWENLINIKLVENFDQESSPNSECTLTDNHACLTLAMLVAFDSSHQNQKTLPTFPNFVNP
uniref:F-box domain-containing protein n=1 Tax=Strongyloides venezuelensis TaxID=75913 RepID=A0A0K0G5S5_STRVS